MNNKSDHLINLAVSSLQLKLINLKSIEGISLDSLQLHRKTIQTGTYIYNTSKFVAKQLSPLSKNEF